MRCLLFLILLMGVGRASAEEPDPSAMPVKKMTIRATAAPVPALRYTLLPELRDTTPGNAVQLYYRAFSPDWISSVRSNAKLMESVYAATEKPLAELKADADLAFFRNWNVLREVDRAARRTYCDWELTPRIREDGANLLLPDVQSMREYVRYLAVRMRLELADGDFDAAIRSMQTGLAMGRHVADAPTLIQTLVGVAIDSTTFDQVEELIRTPGSPNLYWALATLPRPFVDMRRPYEGERLFIDQIFPGFREGVRAKKMPPQSSAMLEKVQKELRSMLDRSFDLNMLMAAVVKYTPAKKLLIEQGWAAGDVEALPAFQVVMLGEIINYDRWYDEMMKWMVFPHHVVRKEMDAVEHRFKGELTKQGGPALSLAGMLLPATIKVQFAVTRVDRRIAALMAIEALRLHAVAAGSLPNSLTEVKVVPVLPDPVTGTPFVYEKNGDTATLTMVPPTGEQPNAGNSLKYELTLAK